jgi:shikimate kinase
MAAQRNIVLFGFMGSGKTSVGKQLAGRLGMTFLDMDEVIEARQGKSIPRIFAEEGEPRFRALERELVKELAARRGLVVATGGGVVLNPDNVRDYAGTGLAVCLRASPEAILSRVGSDTNRPLLAVGDKMGKIRSLLDARRRFYEAIPLQIDTTALTVNEVVDAVLRAYGAGQA